MKSLSTDLAEMAIVMQVAASAGELTREAAFDLAAAFQRYSIRATRLEDALREAHVDRVAIALDPACEAAIGQGIVDGTVIDLRGEFYRELRDRGRPVPPHLAGNDGDAA